MVQKSKLKAALDAEKGIDHKLERQKKLRKTAEKKRRSKVAEGATVDAVEDSTPQEVGIGSGQDVDLPVRTSQPPAEETGGLPTPPDEEEQEEEEAEAEDEPESDIPFSDLESLASEDREDLLPRQRLTINNHKALTAALESLNPLPQQPFSEHMSILSPAPTSTSIPDPDDDLPRELAFYRQSLTAALHARRLLRQEQIPFTRPADYFAEMLKTDEHMGRVRGKLTEEASRRKAGQEARKLRDAKKFGKQVQVARLQERAKEKRETLDRIKVLKRKRAGGETPGAGGPGANEEELFDVALEKETRAERAPKGVRDGERGVKRQKKDSKFGFGGRKRFAKSNDAVSTGDMSRFSGRGAGKGAGGRGGVKARTSGPAKRLGKSRRTKGSK